MSTRPDFDRHASDWLADGPTELADRVLDAALREVHLTRQRRRWSAPWRASLMSLRLSAAALIAIIAVAGVVAFNMLGNGGVETRPTPLPTTLPSATSAPAAVPSPTRGPLDTSTWVPYTSTRYGISIDHPAEFTERPADRDWTFEADAANWLSTAQESFVRTDGQVRVSAWSVAVETGTSVEAWMQAYCLKNTAPCTGIVDQAIPVYAEPRDRHPGLLVAFADDVQAFFLNVDRIYVVACWRPDDHPSVARYGGSIRLVEAMALSMTLGTPGPTAPSP